MNTLKEQAHHTPDVLRLSDTERGSMRLALAQYQRNNPLHRSKGAWFGRLSFVRVGIPVFAAVLLCATSAYAAQVALPGDLLYPVKINVTEPLQVALATSPQARASVEAKLADNRVTEAQALAARGTLTDTETQELEASFNTHAAQAIALAGDVAPASTTEVAVLSTPATSTGSISTTTAVAAATTTATSTPVAHPIIQKGFAVELRASLHAQANIFVTLQAQMATSTSGPGEDTQKQPANEATSSATSTPRLLHIHNSDGL